MLGCAVVWPALCGSPAPATPTGIQPRADLPVRFEDVAPDMAADATGHGAGVAWADYDSDGDQDLYIVNLGNQGRGEANRLLRNDGHRMADVTNAKGVGNSGPGAGVAWADYDNDGDLDLFVSNRPGANALYVNEGAGRFSSTAAAAGVADSSAMGEGAAWGDSDQDGLVDLYVANYTGAQGPAGQPNRLYRNLDGARFRDIAVARGVADGGNGESVSWCDFDNDGDLDIYVANAGGGNALYQREADGTYRNATADLHVPGGPGRSFGVAWADYDNDGWFDLYVAQEGPNKLYRNLGGIDFADVSDAAAVAGGGWSLGCAWADYDNDGDVDLHVANADVQGHDPADVLYRNDSGEPPSFTDVTASAGITNTLDSRGSAWADYDDDGDLDLYVVNQGDGQPNRLFRNEGPSGHWLHVTLVGCPARGSNRAAIGARLAVTTDRLLSRDISGGSGFASQDSLPLELGLGSWSEPVSIEVRWPGGFISTFADVPVDQHLAASEPCQPPRLLLPLALRDAPTP